MEPRDQQPTIDKLAIIACEASGINAFHNKDGKMMYQRDEAQSRAREALSILGGVGREPMA